MENESDVAAFKDFVDDTPAGAPAAAAPSPKPTATPTSAPIPSPPSPPKSVASTPPKSVPVQAGSRILVSPLAKRLAAEKGLNLSVSIAKSAFILIILCFYYICLISVNWTRFWSIRFNKSYRPK